MVPKCNLLTLQIKGYFFPPHVGTSGTRSTILDLSVKLATFLAAIAIENMETKTSKQNFLFL